MWGVPDTPFSLERVAALQRGRRSRQEGPTASAPGPVCLTARAARGAAVTLTQWGHCSLTATRQDTANAIGDATSHLSSHQSHNSKTYMDILLSHGVNSCPQGREVGPPSLTFVTTNAPFKSPRTWALGEGSQRASPTRYMKANSQENRTDSQNKILYPPFVLLMIRKLHDFTVSTLIEKQWSFIKMLLEIEIFWFILRRY